MPELRCLTAATAKENQHASQQQQQKKNSIMLI